MNEIVIDLGLQSRRALRCSASGVELQLALEISGDLGGVIGRVMEKLANKYLALEADGVKRCCEGATS
ncbi:MAG: hypothetical protein PVI37_04685 [Gammaproteobacteria bacterium]|jgi:hypothetical protein